MQIYGPYRVSTTQSQAASQRSQSPKADAAPKSKAEPVDQLDLSNSVAGTNRLDQAQQVSVGGDIRIDRVAEIRRQIADGSYESSEKLDAALDRLLDQIA